MSQTNSSDVDFIVKHKKLIAQLLDIAADKFSNHGCNDFDLTDSLPDRGDRHKLAKAVFDEDDPDRYNSDNDYEVINDYELMLFFANKIRNLD